MIYDDLRRDLLLTQIALLLPSRIISHFRGAQSRLCLKTRLGAKPLGQFQLSVETHPGLLCFCFTSLWLVQKINTTLNQSEAELKPITTSSLVLTGYKRYFSFFWFAVVINSLVLVLRHLVQSDLIWKWTFIIMQKWIYQIKIMSTRKVLQLTSVWKWDPFRRRNGLSK